MEEFKETKGQVWVCILRVGPCQLRPYFREHVAMLSPSLFRTPLRLPYEVVPVVAFAVKANRPLIGCGSNRTASAVPYATVRYWSGQVALPGRDATELADPEWKQSGLCHPMPTAQDDPGMHKEVERPSLTFAAAAHFFQPRTSRVVLRFGLRSAFYSR